MVEAIVPKPLESGELVAIIAPAGPVDAARLAQGARVLRDLGFRVRTGAHALEREGYLAGSDEKRLADLNAALGDPDVRAILCARGGYGVMRLLDRVDTDAVRRDPKVILGMSDITALQLALYVRCGLVTYSGPLIAGQVALGLDEVSRAAFVRALTTSPDRAGLFGADWSGVRVVREGKARGPLLGGCLSMVTALAGTESFPDWEGAILLLEEVNEPLYRIDRMLTHLRLAGVFDRVAGVALGHMLGPKGEDLGPETDRLMEEITAWSRIPIISGAPHGHGLPNVTLPLGLEVTLDTASVGGSL
jgi:muramoyltetrapeptide carboxypeptidase